MIKKAYQPSLTLIFLILFNPAFSQHPIDQINAVNEITLGDDLSTLISQLQMITGNETVYQNNPGLAKSLQRNLKNGIREGINVSETKRILNGYSASDHRILFFKEKVFKSRWDFDRSDFSSLKTVFNDFIVYYTRKFGKPDETIRDYAVIWKGEVNRLQIFFDEQTVQIEFRNDRVEETVKALNILLCELFLLFRNEFGLQIQSVFKM